ncbi:MAG: ABC transporter ATP-binding protein [Chlorobia bacterium]|nr:ABC transporter ATP-binding protein [Fimbriimonadaceae bacterium]
MSFAVEMTRISKRFGDVVALDAVDLHVEQGTIHAVVGENGAGKTTLMKALYGALHTDSGVISIEGQTVTFKSSAQAIQSGVGMVSQHYGIIPDLTCLQNLILGAEGGPFLNLLQAENRAQSLAAKMGFEFDWNRDAAELSPAGAQKLEILKLLWRNSRIMILDEPTAMLSPADGEALFQSLRLLVAEGNTVILVTHRLPEVFGHCSRVTVLRGGKRVAEKMVSETNPSELAELIVGKRLEAPSAYVPNIGEVVLEVSNLDVKGYRGNLAAKGLNFKVRAGEMVGIAGVDGSGQRELFHALIGTAPIQGGQISLLARDATKLSSWDRLQAGMRAIPEDRHAEAVIEEWSLDENAALGLQRMEPFASGRIVHEGARRVASEQISERFHTKHGGIDQPIASLSGGNQQRFVAARALFGEPKLILAFQPARGLDLAATRDVYEGIRSECDQGAGALVVSYDLDELLEHCDRIVVMNRGELFEPKAGEEKDSDVIGRLMVGAE